MARTISKTLMVTRVTYKTAEVRDGEAVLVDHPDAVFSGLQGQDKVERLLKAQLGKDAIPVITNVDAGQHRYEMDLATFVLNARIADGEPEDALDPDDPSEPAPATDGNSDHEPVSAPEADVAAASETAPALTTLASTSVAADAETSPGPAPASEPVPQGSGSGAAAAVDEDEDDGVEV